jgi:hypothetical protein
VQTQNEEDTMKKLSERYVSLLRGALSLAAVLAFTASTALAQVPSSSPPYNIDLGSSSAGAPIKNVIQVPATVNSAQLNNLDKQGAICTLVTTALSGSPSVLFSIQNFDVASGQYYNVVASLAISAPTINTPYSIAVEPGITVVAAGTSSPLAGATAFPLSRIFRVQEVITGANTAVTGTIGCNLLVR